jgi:MinD superfamily P-loop ATPase
MSVEEYVFLSGKGGSGKTTVCAAWAHLSGEFDGARNPVVVDADVDAANLELLSRSHRRDEHVFVGASLPVIDPESCTGCGRCVEVCRFEAAAMADDRAGRGPLPRFDPILCEGCGACLEVCPTGAVRLVPQRSGSWFRSESRFGPLFHAALLPGGENSGKLVARVRDQARRWAEANGYGLLLTDGPPGIGCPVISAVSGASGIIAVAEAGETGRNDLERLLELARRFDLPVELVINKADIHPGAADAMEALGREEGIEVLGRIPFDPQVVHRMVRGEPVTADAASPAAAALRELYRRWSHRRSSIY